MQKAKVISLAISGMNKTIYRVGDKVSEVNFPDGQFKKLVKAGHLEITTATPIKDIKAALSKTENFGQIAEIIDGDDRKEVKEAAESRKQEIRDEGAAGAKKAQEKAAKEAKDTMLAKIDEAKTVGALKAISAGATDEEILKAVEAKTAELTEAAEKKKAEASEKEKADKEKAEKEAKEKGEKK